jgi:GcrA cell cycle regulator
MISAWTDERIETLRKLWADGLSSSQIAHDLNCGISRNAVIGKVYRLGLSGRSKKTFRSLGAAGEGSGARTEPRKPVRIKPVKDWRPNSCRPVKIGTHFEMREVGPVMTTYETPIDDLAIPLKQRCTLVELNDHRCRWPVGDVGSPGFFFCGGETIEGQPYCGEHCRRAFDPRSVPRRLATWRLAA